MRKTWIKPDNIYYKPFYKQKLKLALVLVVAMSILFFIYQLVYISQLPSLESLPAELLRRREKNQLNHGKRKPKVEHRSQIGNKTDAIKQTLWFDKQFVYVEKIGNYEQKILRGIRLVDIHHYSEKHGLVQFRCVSSGKEIPWDRVNDDYCDCPDDGSDEPSTSACSQGRFYCRFQKRHKTGRGKDVFVSSGRVNDGVCDCCDGSDEWLTEIGISSVSLCPDICKMQYMV